MARDQTVPVRIMEAEVGSLSHEGRGIARLHGKAVFIDGALPGESVVFRYARRRARFDEGVAVEVRQPSALRVEPICRHYRLCGGCSLQHLAPEEQIRHKESVLLEHLHRIAGVEPAERLAPLSGPTRGYRRRARLGVRYDPGKGRVLVGFHERRSNRIADIDSCEVLHPAAARLLKPLSELVGALAHPDAVPQIEVAVGDDGAAVVMRHLRELPEQDRALLRGFERAQGVQLYLQPGGEDSVHPLSARDGGGLCYRLPEYDIEIRFGPMEFTQVNFDLNQSMVKRVIGLLAAGPGDDVLDLFCGLGNFTLPLARLAAQVTGVEGSKFLVDRARTNAGRNRLANVEFHTADLYAQNLQASFLLRRYHKVLLDPPRKGAGEIIGRLDLAGTSHIAYVSCNPATLARDAALLVRSRGFILSKAGVIDMFPHTSHVESLALFERK